MAVANPILQFPDQIAETRKCIKYKFSEYRQKLLLQNETVESLRAAKSFNSEKLKTNILTETREEIVQLLDHKLAELTAEADYSIEFVWDDLFETDIEQLGVIKLNGLSMSPTRNFPPLVKPVVPDYKAKQLPTAYCCKKSSDDKAPGEMYLPRGIAIHYKTGNIYIGDMNNHRVQVFSCNGEYLFLFSEKMNKPVGICISHNNVFVTQYGSHCLNMYELEGKLIKSAGSEGSGEAQFKDPFSLDASERSNNIYVCDASRVQILTQTLKYHSMLGIGLFNHPRDVKITRDRVYVLDTSDPCLFVFNSDHVLTNRLITRGAGKQVCNPFCFDIDRDYNIIVSDYRNHCVYVFNQEGEQIHQFGKEGQGIGEFYRPFGIALDNTGHIIIVCQKDSNCLQFF